MNQVNQNINKDMIDSELIDLNTLDLSDNQTWLYKLPNDSGQNMDFVDWSLSYDFPINKDDEYLKAESDYNSILDNILKNQILSMPDKHKFDSRTYVKPKKRSLRPSIQSIMEVSSNPSSLTNTFTNSGTPANKYLTYNKYSMPLGPISPMLRLKTFNVDTNSDNSHSIKEYATKRRSLVQDDDPQLEDVDVTLVSENSDRLSSEHVPTKPINIDLSQPAHNLHNTFNKGLTNVMNERGSLNMYQSGESLMRMSPPSLVSSLLMEGSGSFPQEPLDTRRPGSMTSHRDSGLPTSGRESIDPMMTSMTLSILDEKDMNTSFLSQTTYPDNDSLIDSLPPSLVNSVNSSFVVSQNIAKTRADNGELNVFSSPTYTHLDQTDKLLTARPRVSMFNSYTKRDSALRKSESYTKSREESSQIDTQKILNENNEQKESPKKMSPEMSETITLHTNNKFRCNDAEKENVNATFEEDDAFYRDMGMQKTCDHGKDSINVTLDKQELNEIIQARQKLSLARKALPSKPEKPFHSESPSEIIQLPNQIIKVPKKSMENASELLSRRRAINSNGCDKEPTRDLPKRNATFKIPSPRSVPMDATVVYVKADETQMIDINSATLNLIDSGERAHQLEWNAQERAMVGSSESTDTSTFSSSSPPESVPESAPSAVDSRISSTPLLRNRKEDILKMRSTISPIYDIIDDKSYTVTAVPNATPSMNTNAINTAIMKKPTAKRDILARNGREKKILGPYVPQKIPPTNTASYGSIVPPPSSTVVRKTGLPTSKLRQYSSHKELSRIPGSSGASGVPGGAGRVPPASRVGAMYRRTVYASNPALSPTAPHPPAPIAPPIRRDSYVIVDHQSNVERPEPAPAPKPPLVRQATETLQRDKVGVKDRLCGSGVPVSMRVQQASSRSNSVPGSSAPPPRPASGPPQRLPSALGSCEQTRPASGSSEARVSALPRPSRLPAPRRTLRPPSVYSVAQTGGDMEQY